MSHKRFKFKLFTYVPQAKRIVVYNSLIQSHFICEIEVYTKNKCAWTTTFQKSKTRMLIKISFNLSVRTSTG